MAQTARTEIRCVHCAEQWFGAVTYCPYCGLSARLASDPQEGDDRLPLDDAPLQSGPMLGIERLDEPEEPVQPGLSASSVWGPSGLVWLLSALLVISAALFLWLGRGNQPAPTLAEKAPTQLPQTAEAAARISGAPASGLAPAVALPPSRTAAQPPPNRSLCSVASEAAGLCTVQ